MELKNGETYNGNLMSCDNFMNIHLRDVICTSRVSLVFLNRTCIGYIYRMGIDFGKFLNVMYGVIP